MKIINNILSQLYYKYYDQINKDQKTTVISNYVKFEKRILKNHEC